MVTVIFALLTLSTTARDDTYPADVQKIIDGILAAKYPHERVHKEGADFKSLFNKVGPEGLKKLKNHPNTTIALQAAWELVEQTPPLNNKIDRKTIEDFIAFLEKRCDVKCPDWWRSSFLEASVNRIRLKGPEPDIYRWSSVDRARCPLNAQLISRNGTLVYQEGADSIEIPSALLKRSDRDRLWDNVIGLFTKSQFFITHHDGHGSRHTLTSIDRRSGKILWQSEVWGSWWNDSEGLSRGWVALTEQGNRIVVFGLSGRFNVEAFDSKDGKNLFRFSNSYR
jgi:hypothetical protein